MRSRLISAACVWVPANVRMTAMLRMRGAIMMASVERSIVGWVELLRNPSYANRVDGLPMGFASLNPSYKITLWLPQYHQRVERERALAPRQRHERIDVDRLDALAEIVRQAAERQHGGEHALAVGRRRTAIAVEQRARIGARQHRLGLPARKRDRPEAHVA